MGIFDGTWQLCKRPAHLQAIEMALTPVVYIFYLNIPSFLDCDESMKPVYEVLLTAFVMPNLGRRAYLKPILFELFLRSN